MSATDPHQATHQALHRTIEAVWRIESARVIAGLTRLTRDVGLAEDLAQEALVAALEQWPQSGVPDNPAAWLTATAKRRAIDLFRRNAVAQRKHQELARELEALEQTSPDLDSTLDNTISRTQYQFTLESADAAALSTWTPRLGFGSSNTADSAADTHSASSICAGPIATSSIFATSAARPSMCR